MMFVLSSICGKAFDGMMAAQKVLSGKLALNEATMLLQPERSLLGVKPLEAQIAGALLTHIRPVDAAVSAGNRNSSVVRLIPVRRSRVILSYVPFVFRWFDKADNIELQLVRNAGSQMRVLVS